MARQSWAISTILGLVLLTGSHALAAPALTGNTGLIKTPTAEVLHEGDFRLGFTWIGGPRSILFSPKPNRMYYAAMGLLPGLEVTLNMLQVVGWVDPEAPGVAHAFHRMSHLKYRLPLPDSWPSVALGTQDPLSVNALTRGPVGQTNYGLTSVYGVMSKPIGPWTVHLGYSSQADMGVFGGAECEVGYGVTGRAEYDGGHLNLGLDWHPSPWFRLYGARLLPDDWAFGTALLWRF